MKFSLLAVAAVITSAGAFKPKTKITIHDGKFNALDDVETFMDIERTYPTLVVKTEVEGIEATLDTEVDIQVKPEGVAVSKVKGAASWDSVLGASWTVTGETEPGDGYVSVDVEGDIADASVVLGAKATITSDEITPNSAGFTKTLAVNGGSGSFSFTPTYYPGEDAPVPFDIEFDYESGDNKITATVDSDMGKSIEASTTFDATKTKYKYENDEHEVEIDYSMDKTDIKLTATKEAQKVKISQQVTDIDTVSPTFESNGDITVAWERDLGDDNTLTTTVGNSDSATIVWKDDNWVVNGKVQLNGIVPEDIEFHMKREIEFEW